MFAGGIIAWLVLIPAVVFFGGSIDFATLGNTGLAGQTIAEVYEADGASAIWSNVIKYVGAGAIATGGVISLLKSLPLIIKTFAGAMKSLKNTSGGTNVRTDRDLKMPVVLGIILIVIILIWLARIIRKPIAKTAADIENIANGNISNEISGSSQIAETDKLITASRILKEKLNDIVSGVNEHVLNLQQDTASLKERADFCNDGTKQISQAMEELSVTAVTLAENVQDVNA